MKNQYTVTKKMMFSWVKEFPGFTLASVVIYILYSIALVIGLSLLVTLSMYGGDSIDWLIGILIILISVYRLFLSRLIRTLTTYKNLSSTFNATEWVQTVEFCEDKIKVSLHNSTGEYDYRQIKKIIERGNSGIIVFKNGALRLYKDAFVEGSWEECKEKLTAHIKKS